MPLRRGRDEVSEVLRWLAARWTNATDYRFDLVAAGVSGDLAYLVGFEHIANTVVGAPVEPYTLRVTHIFRREQGEWKIAHRHADYVPIDQTTPPTHRRSRRSSSGAGAALGPHRGHIPPDCHGQQRALAVA